LSLNVDLESSQAFSDKIKETLIKSIDWSDSLARGAGNSVKPGVERSGTPGGGQC